VAGNKLLFLMVWDIVNAGRITVNPGRHIFRKSTGAVVVTLLPATVSVVVVIRNCWQRNSFTVPLKHISLDKESLASLTADLRLFARINVVDMQPGEVNFFPNIRVIEPVLQTFQCQLKIEPHFISQNFYQHEP